jgi:hypothetical protein
MVGLLVYNELKRICSEDVPELIQVTVTMSSDLAAHNRMYSGSCQVHRLR